MEPRIVVPRRSCCALGACLLVPNSESVRPDHAMGMGCKSVSAETKVTVDEGVSAEEVLGLFGRFEPLHLSLASSRRRVGRCEFSARLFRYRLCRCSPPGSS